MVDAHNPLQTPFIRLQPDTLRFFGFVLLQAFPACTTLHFSSTVLPVRHYLGGPVDPWTPGAPQQPALMKDPDAHSRTAPTCMAALPRLTQPVYSPSPLRGAILQGKPRNLQGATEPAAVLLPRAFHSAAEQLEHARASPLQQIKGKSQACAA